MSYEKAKSIRINRNKHTVIYVSKANNDTAPFRLHTKSIPDFLTALIGGIIQSDQTSEIMRDWYANQLVRELSEDFYFDLCRYGIDVMRRDIQELFAHFCDRLSNELPSQT